MTNVLVSPTFARCEASLTLFINADYAAVIGGIHWQTSTGLGSNLGNM